MSEPEPAPEPALPAMSDEPTMFEDPAMSDEPALEPIVVSPVPFSFFLQAVEPNARDTASKAIAIRMGRMLPFFPVRSIVLLMLCTAIAHAAPDVRMPPGTRTDASGQLVSGKGLRDSTDFIARELDRKGIIVRQVGPYRVRGIELTRFVSETPSTPWLAIHVMRSAGKTLIFFVGRPSP